MMRLVEAEGTAQVTAITTVAQEIFGPLRVELDAPEEDLRYRIYASFDVINNSSATAMTVAGELDVSYDDGVNWETAEIVERRIHPRSQENINPTFILDNLPAFPTVAPESVLVRLRSYGSIDGAGIVQVNNPESGVYLGLSEHL
jgi:hypothetical protein